MDNSVSNEGIYIKTQISCNVSVVFRISDDCSAA